MKRNGKIKSSFLTKKINEHLVRFLFFIKVKYSANFGVDLRYEVPFNIYLICTSFETTYCRVTISML